MSLPTPLGDFRHLPLSFERNGGRFDPEVRFVARGARSTLFLTSAGAGLALARGAGKRSAVVHIGLVGGDPHAPLAARGPQTGVVDQINGRHPSQWHTGIPAYAGAGYGHVYDGIDLSFHGDNSALEYDFVVRPGADPAAIGMRFRGARDLRLRHDGSLIMSTAAGELVQRAPVVYQQTDDGRHSVPGRYELHGETVRFRIGAYDPRRTLTIDPVFVYSRLLGGSGADQANGVAVDAAGSAYIVGTTASANFPGSTTLSGTQDAFVYKLSPDGTTRQFSAFVGGTGLEEGLGIATSADQVFLTGWTTSTNFPLNRASQSLHGGGRDAFIVSFEAAGGSPYYATYLGGSGDDEGRDISAGAGLTGFVTGVTASSDFPRSPGALGDKPGDDAFLTKYAPSTAFTATYSGYFGGAGADRGVGVAAEPGTNSAVIVGSTTSSDLPAISSAQATFGGGTFDGFVTKVDTTTLAGVRTFSTYLGGSGDDFARGVAFDAGGRIVVAGDSASDGLAAGSGIDAQLSSQRAGLLVRYTATGAKQAATYLDAPGPAPGRYVASGVAVDGTGAIWWAGTDDRNPADPHDDNIDHSRVVRIDSAFSRILRTQAIAGGRSEVTGGIAADAAGNAYVAGYTTSTDFPATSDSHSGFTDAYVVKLDGVPPDTVIDSTQPDGPNVSIAFHAVPGAGATFRCGLDGAPMSACSSPFNSPVPLSPGTHSFRVAASDDAGNEDLTPASTTFEIAAAGPGSTTTEPGPAPPAEMPTISLFGPDVLRYNETARLNVVVRPQGAVQYAWDLDGDGGYERNTGSTPYADATFSKAGQVTVAVRAVLADGALLTATKAITVTRPSAVTIRMSPGYPLARQKVSFDVDTQTDGQPFRMFAWRFPGLRALNEEATLKPVAASRVAGSSSQYSTTVELDGATPSPTGDLTRKLTKPGPQRVELTSLSPTGERLRTTFTVNALEAGEKVKSAFPDVIDCNKWDGPGFCAGMTVPDPVLLSLPTSFQAVLAKNSFCVPANYTVSDARGGVLRRVTSKLDLVDPASDIVSTTATKAPAQRRAQSRGAGPRATPGVEKDCIGKEPEIISWDFGDGTKLPDGGTPAGTAVKHVYTGPERDVTVGFLARVYLVTECKPNCPEQPGNLATKFAKLTPVLVRLSRKIQLTTPVCGPRQLRGVPVTTTFAPGGQAAGGCFVKVASADGKRTLYQTVYGAGLVVDGVAVRADPPPWVETIPPLLVDEQLARIDAADGSGLAFVGPGDVPTDGFSYTARVGGGVEITKPASFVLPSQDGSPSARHTITASKFLPEPKITAGLRPIAGFLADNIEFFLQPSQTATVRSWVNPPEPLTGPVPIITGGGLLSSLRSTAEDDQHTDFKLDLGSKDFGFLRIDDVLLAHRTAGGWYGGGGMSIPALGISVNAKYKRPPGFSPTQCEVPGTGEIYGPSGFSLDYDNSFEFGGIGVFPKHWNILGLEVTCIAIHGQTDPLVLVGNFDGQWPSGKKIIGISGCLLFAKVVKGDEATGCNESVTAKNNYYWFRASAALNVLDVFTLDGYFDVRVGKIVGAPKGKDDILEIRLGGGLSKLDLGPFYLKNLKVDGLAVIKPKFGFDVSAKTRFCVWGISAIGGALTHGDGCVQLGGFVSSKGAMVCAASVGGWMQWKPFDAGLVSSCDLEASPLHVKGNTRVLRPFSVRGHDAEAAQLGGAAVKTVNVAKGLSKVGFEAAGVGGAPRVKVTDPSGAVVVADSGDPNATVAPGVSGFTAEKAGEVFLNVKHPKAGVWKFEALPDTPAIQALVALKLLVEPNVVAKAVGIGANRRLVYRARLAKGDKLRFEEHGDAMSRTLGTGRNGKGTLPMPALATSPGKRTIRAIVERNGLPYKIFEVAGYTAPKLPSVGKPLKVRAKQTKRGLFVTWKRAKLASEYVVTVRLTKKAVLRRTVAKRAVLFPEIAAHARARVAVVAVDALQRKGKPATATRKPGKAPKAVVKL